MVSEQLMTVSREGLAEVTSVLWHGIGEVMQDEEVL